MTSIACCEFTMTVGVELLGIIDAGVEDGLPDTGVTEFVLVHHHYHRVLE